MRRPGTLFALASMILLLAACPAPRRVLGVVYDGARLGVFATGAAFVKPLRDATVTWSCPSGGPAPQKLTTDYDGRFASKDFHEDMPASCELVVSKPGYQTFREKFDQLCEDPPMTVCRQTRVAVQLIPEPPPPTATVALSATAIPGTPAVQTVLTVTLAADGAAYVDGAKIADDEAVLPAARGAMAKNPEVRAVIKADKAVAHGRVVHVLDLLKQAGVSKIAFGVSSMPLATAPEPIPPSPAPATTR
jgi:biopolymer transport protein ExbD